VSLLYTARTNAPIATDVTNLIILSRNDPLDLDLDVVVVVLPPSFSRLDSLCLFTTSASFFLSSSD